jgi:hypothetical protein
LAASASHDLGDERRRSGRHRFKPAKIHQTNKTGRHLIQFFPDPHDGFPRLIQGHGPGHAQDEKLFRGVGFDDEH